MEEEVCRKLEQQRKEEKRGVNIKHADELKWQMEEKNQAKVREL